MATNALNGMQIYIRMFGGNEMVNIYPGWTVWRLKQYLAERHGHRPEQLRVIFAGSELPNSLGFEVGWGHFGFRMIYFKMRSYGQQDRLQ